VNIWNRKALTYQSLLTGLMDLIFVFRRQLSLFRMWRITLVCRASPLFHFISSVFIMPAQQGGFIVHSFSSTTLKRCYSLLVLLRWQEFATRSVAVFCLTYHRGGGGKYWCSMHHALRVRVDHLSGSLPLTPHHAAHVNCRRR